MSLKDDLELNKPRRTPGHATKSHVVKTNVGGKPKMIRFGEQGASTAGAPSPNDSEETKAKRKAFKDRHAKNIAKGPASAAYWANKVKWADGGAVEERKDLPWGSLGSVAKDVTLDALSGTFGPIGAAMLSGSEQLFQNKTIEELEANNAAYNEMFNYTPKTAGGRYINETSMQALGSVVNAGMEDYNRRLKEVNPDANTTGLQQMGKAWDSLPREAQFALTNAATVSELAIPMLGKVKGVPDPSYTGPMDLAEMAAKYEQDGPSPEEMQANTDAVQQRLIDSGMAAPMMQVKEPGGNFPNIEFQSSPESVIETVIDKTFMGYDNQTLNRPGEELVSGWLRNKGKKYITKEMGTGQGDSLVQMFGKYGTDPNTVTGGPPIVHIDPAVSAEMFNPIRGRELDRARDEGRPITSSNNTPLAAKYERMSDEEIITTTLDDLSASDRRELIENQPFYATAPDDTVVHFLRNEQVGTRLGFDTIADELSNMVDPDNLSGLPAEFLLSEKDLNKLTLEQASRKVGEARVWRKTDADRKELIQFTESLEVVYQDPEFVNKSTGKKKDRPAPGMKWVLIDDVLNDANMKSCNIIGDKGGWCTGGRDYAKEYTEGDKFIVAALDNNNQPQAQVALYMQENYGVMVTNVLEVAPPGNRLDSDKVTVRMERDPEYLNKVTTSTAKFLNNLNETETLGEVKLDGYSGGMHGEIADVKLLSAGGKIPNTGNLNFRVRANSPISAYASPSLKRMLGDIYMGQTPGKDDFTKSVIQLLGRPKRVGQELPRFMTKNDVIEFIKENGDEKTAAGLKKNENAVVFVEQITSMRDDLRALTANMRAGPVLADLMSMNPTDLLATRTAMRQQLDRELDQFVRRRSTGMDNYTQDEVISYTSLLENRRAELSQEYTDLQVADLTGFSPNEIADMDLSVLSELVEECIGYANQRLDAQIDADGLLDDDIELDAEMERQADLRNELTRIQNERGDVDFAYTEDEMLNMSYNDLRETIDQYNEYPPEYPTPDNNNNLNTATLIDAIPTDRTLAEYRELAFAPSGTVSGLDRLDGFHAMIQTSGWDETGEIRVNLRDPQMNEGIWPDGKENLLVEAKEVMEDYQLGSRTIDETMDDLFLIASDRDREFIVNNYSDIKLMIMGDDFMTAADYNINNFARGGSVTYNPERINQLSKRLLAGNYYEGGSVTYNPERINKLSEQLMETYNV